MLTILGSVLGFATSAVPTIMDFFKEKEEKKAKKEQKKKEKEEKKKKKKEEKKKKKEEKNK